MKAVVVQSKGKAAVTEVEDPPVRGDYVKIKVHSVALNPTDWKHIDAIALGGEIVGCDVAGTVEEVGSEVTTPVKKGDRIAGMVHGSNQSSPRDGGFADRAEIKDGVFLHLPASWSWAEGATLGIGITTVGQALYQSLQLPSPENPTQKPYPVLIYGGSTATGTLAIQFAKASGLQVIAIASPRHFESLKSLGASLCFDYNKDGVGEYIRRETNDNLLYAFDCIGDGQSMKIIAAALTSGGDGKEPRYSSLSGTEGFPRDDCNARQTMAYTGIGESYTKFGNTTDAIAEDLKFAQHFWALTGRLIAEGKIKTHPTDERSGGLEGIVSGLKDLKGGQVRGKKVVFAL